MALYSIEESTMRDIADAVKEKTGDTEIAFSEIASKLKDVPTGNRLMDFVTKTLTELRDDEVDAISSPPRAMFSDQKLLETVGVDSELKALSIEMFQGCSSLKRIKMSDTVKTIPSLCFYNCSSLHNFDFSNLTSIAESAFAHSGIREANLTGVRVGSNCFNDCKDLEKVVLDTENSSQVLNLFRGTSSLKECTLAEGLTIIDSNWFTGTGLEHITLPSTLTRLGSQVFLNSVNLKEITIPAKVSSMSDSCFDGCSSLESATFLNTMATFPGYTFRNTALKTIRFPEGITTISSQAFYNAPLDGGDVVFPSTLKVIADSAFQNNKVKRFHVPPTLTQAYGLYSDYSKELLDDESTGVYISELLPFLNIKYGSSTSYLQSTFLYGRKYLYLNGVRVQDLIIPAEITTLKTSMLHGFHGNSIVIPSTVTKLEPGSLAAVRLKEFTMPKHSMTVGAAFVKGAYIEHFKFEEGFDNSFGSYLLDSSMNGMSSADAVVPTILNLDFTGAKRLPGRFAYNLKCPNGIVVPENVTRIGSYFAYYLDTRNANGVAQGLIMKSTTPPTYESYALQSWSSSQTYYTPIRVPVGSLATYQSATGWATHRSNMREDPIAGGVVPEPEPLSTPKFTKAGQDLFIYETAHATSATIEYATSAEGPWSLFMTVDIDPAFGQAYVEYSTWWHTMENLGLSEAYLRVKTSVEGADDSAYSETVFLTRPGATQQFPNPVIALNSGDLMVQAASKIDTVTLYWRYTDQPNDELSKATTITLGNEDTVYESGGTYFHYPDDFYEPNLSAILRNTGGPVGGDSVDLYVTVSASGYTESELSNPVTFIVSYES